MVWHVVVVLDKFIKDIYLAAFAKQEGGSRRLAAGGRAAAQRAASACDDALMRRRARADSCTAVGKKKVYSCR